MFIRQHGFRQSLHQMMTLGSGMVSGLRAEASLPQAQSTPTVSHDTTRLCPIVVSLWDCHIHADAVRALSWIFFMYFLLSDGGSIRLVKNAEVELAIVYISLFRLISLGKSRTPLRLPSSYELNSITTVFQQGLLWHWIT